MKTILKFFIFFVIGITVLFFVFAIFSDNPETPPAEDTAQLNADETMTPLEDGEAFSEAWAATETAWAEAWEATETAWAEMYEPTKVVINEDELVFDMGFRPETHGFGFPNYGDENGAEDLTPAEMQRMFGDQVCAILNEDGCVLTPPAQQWMKQANQYMAGGHCEGMAVLSLLMYADHVDESEYGADEAAELPFVPDLQREIAYWWATQMTTPTYTSRIKGTPAEILDVLMSMDPGKETYTIGIFKRDGSGGHAVTPFAVADRGDGLYAVLVYDNNYPGEARELYIDANANTWEYEASPNPEIVSSLYEGDAETMTLELTPTSARLGEQICSFCGGAQAGKAPGLAMQAVRYNEIFLDGDGHLLMEDDQGRYLGYKDGRFVNEIPGAKVVSMLTGSPLEDDPEPVYWLPQGVNTTIQLDGSTLNEKSPSDLVLVGPGYAFGVEGIQLEPDQVDTIYFMPEEGWLTYDTDRSQSPNIIIAIEEPAADYYFEIQGVGMQGGGEINVLVDPKSGDLIINAEKLTNEGQFNLFLTRIDDEVEQEFYADDLVLKAGSIVYINYAGWEGDGHGLYVGVDLDGDGEIDEEYEAADE